MDQALLEANQIFIDGQVQELKHVIQENIPDELKLDLNPFWILWKPFADQKTRERMTSIRFSEDNPPKLLKLPQGKNWQDPGKQKLYSYLAPIQAELYKPFGLGFVFLPEHPYICIDIDNASSTNSALLKLFNSYSEWSPSGNGVHIWIKTMSLKDKFKIVNTLGKGKRNKSEERDLFISTGYVTVTGKPVQIVNTIEIKMFSADDIIRRLSPYFLHNVTTLPTQKVKETSKVMKELHNQKYKSPDKPKISDRQIQDLLEFLPVKNLTADIFHRLNTPGLSAKLDLTNEEEAREPWLIIGQALHHHYQDEPAGFLLWDAWSKQGNKYDSDAVYSTWHSFSNDKADKPITIATLIALAKAQRLEFPDITSKGIPLCTAENFKTYLDYYNFGVGFNSISNGVEVTPPEKKMTDWSLSNSNFTSLTAAAEFIHGDMVRVGVPPSVFNSRKIRNYLHTYATANTFHPIKHYFDDLQDKWDGVSRLDELMETIKVADNTPPAYHKVYKLFLRKWLIQTVAAAHASPLHSYMLNLVLILQGAQGIGKTLWVKSLFPPDLRVYCAADKDIKISAFRSDMVKLTMELTATLICNINEIDRVFKPQMFSDFKAFLDKTTEQIVLPYGDQTTTRSRQTVFIGSTNKTNFLQDASGNRRFFVMAVKGLTYKHKLDIDQLWAEIYSYYKKKEDWWIDIDSKNPLDIIALKIQNFINNQNMFIQNEGFAELLEDLFDTTAPKEFWNKQTFKQIRNACGMDHMPSNSKLFRECGMSLYLWLKTKPNFKEPWTTSSGGRKYYLMPPLRSISDTDPITESEESKAKVLQQQIEELQQQLKTLSPAETSDSD